MNEITIFANDQFGQIRTTTINNEPWFVGKDIAEILGYKDPKRGIYDHVDDEDKTTVLIQHPGSNYKSQTIIINESGLFSLILSSKLPSAKRFKHWVTSEVLPAIRRTGGYIHATPTMTAEEILERSLTVAQSTIATLQKKNAEHLQQLLSQQPSVDYCRNTLLSVDCITTTQLAKSLGTTAVRLNELLHEMMIQYNQSGQWMLYAKYARKGYAQNRTFAYRDALGYHHTITYLVWTERGHRFVTELVNTLRAAGAKI